MTKKDKKMHNVTIRFSKEEKERLDNYAKNLGVSRGEILRRLFNQEIKGKTIERFEYEKEPPFILYIPKNWNFYQQGLLNTGIDFLTYYKHEPLGKMEYHPLTIKSFNNDLDIWTSKGFTAPTSNFDHEGIIIHKDTTKPDDHVYLINIKTKNNHVPDDLDVYDGTETYSDVKWGKIIEPRDYAKEQLSNQYFATLITLKTALYHSRFAKNEKLMDKLLEFKNNEFKKAQLFETRIYEQLERYKSKKSKPEFIF